MVTRSGSRNTRGRASTRASEPAFAALDLGTNNCRLLVAQRENQCENDPQNQLCDGTFRIVDSFSRIVRLGEGVETTGVLSEAAMARTIGALVVCAEKIRRTAVAGCRCVATRPAARLAMAGNSWNGCARKPALSWR